MSFDVSGLSQYVELNSKEIATKAVANAQTAKLLIDNKQVQVGVKGTAAILKMDTDVSFQDGSSCSRSALGSTTLSDKHITVKPIKDIQNICPKSLYNTFFAEMINKGQVPEESLTSEFAASIMDYRAKKIAAETEKLLWKGDTSLSGANNYKYIDGIIKQAAGSASVAVVSGSTGTIAKLQAAYQAVPVEVRNQDDFRIFVGEDVYANYLIEIANKNVYKPVDDMTLFGTTAKFQVTSGLNGSNAIYLMRVSNLQLGLDGQGDADKAEMRYSIETTNWYMDFYFAVGVAIVYPEQVTVASVA